MKTFLSLLFLCVGLTLSNAAPAPAETPTQAVDRLWKAYTTLETNSNEVSSRSFVDLSKAIAQEQGVAVIAPIMARAKDWKGEEVLIFVPLVSALPRAKVLPILEKYKATGLPYEKQCATDLLIETNPNKN